MSRAALRSLHSVGLLAILSSLAPQCMAADWPGWRGPQGNGITSESSGWEQGAWPLADPSWTRTVGVGATSPVIVGGRVYVMGWQDARDTVMCLDAASGEDIWRQSYECPCYGRYHVGDTAFYRGPSSTPAYDGATGLLYTLSIDGDINCWDTGDGGKRSWGLNLHDTYGVPQRPDAGGGVRDYGYTTAPFLWGDWVIFEAGAGTGSLVAFDKTSGKQAWLSEGNDPAGHTGGPFALTVEGIPCVGVLTLRGLLVARLDRGHEGQTVCKWDWCTDYANSIATPAASGDLVLLTSGYNQSRTEAIRLTLNGAERIWEQRWYSKVCSPVIHQGRVYVAWQQVRCADLATGEVLWKGGKPGDDASCLLTSDERLVVLGNRQLSLLETGARSGGAYVELASRNNVVKGRCWPHVTLANGRLLAKDTDGNLVCFALSK